MAEGHCVVGALIDITNSPENFTHYKTTFKKKNKQNVSTAQLINLSDSNDLSLSECNDPRHVFNFGDINNKANLLCKNNSNNNNNNYSSNNNYKINNEEAELSDQIIPDYMLWDPKMRLDYEPEQVHFNYLIDNEADNCHNQKFLVPLTEATKKTTSLTLKVDSELNLNKNIETNRILTITSTPTDDSAPNVDEKFKMFKKEFSFDSSRSERLGMSIVSSSVGSTIHNNLQALHPNLQPQALFHQGKTAKQISSKPVVPNRRLSTQPNKKFEPTNQLKASINSNRKESMSTNQQKASVNSRRESISTVAVDQQKNKINLKTRVSLAPQPRTTAKLVTDVLSKNPPNITPIKNKFKSTSCNSQNKLINSIAVTESTNNLNQTKLINNKLKLANQDLEKTKPLPPQQEQQTALGKTKTKSNQQQQSTSTTHDEYQPQQQLRNIKTKLQSQQLNQPFSSIDVHNKQAPTKLNIKPPSSKPSTPVLKINSITKSRQNSASKDGHAKPNQGSSKQSASCGGGSRLPSLERPPTDNKAAAAAANSSNKKTTKDLKTGRVSRDPSRDTSDSAGKNQPPQRGKEAYPIKDLKLDKDKQKMYDKPPIKPHTNHLLPPRNAKK